MEDIKERADGEDDDDESEDGSEFENQNRKN
jgi:hypothetical protein